MNGYAYRLKNTGDSSAKYGACMVCGTNAETVYYLVEMRRCVNVDGKDFVTYQNCTDLFGHRDCLSAATERRVAS